MFSSLSKWSSEVVVVCKALLFRHQHQIYTLYALQKCTGISTYCNFGIKIIVHKIITLKHFVLYKSMTRVNASWGYFVRLIFVLFREYEKGLTRKSSTFTVMCSFTLLTIYYTLYSTVKCFMVKLITEMPFEIAWVQPDSFFSTNACHCHPTTLQCKCAEW